MDSSNKPGESEQIDYETLITLALESTSREAIKRDRRNRSKILILVSSLLIIAICAITAVSITAYPEEKELHSEIDNLEKEINALNSDIQSMEQNAGIDVLQRDIDEKKARMEEIKNDESLNSTTKDSMLHDISDQIKELRKIMDDLKRSSKKYLM